MLAIIAVCLSAASLILHAIAPLTKSTLDDKAASAVDAAGKAIPVLAPILGLNATTPSDPNATKATVVPGFGVARDHRTS